MLPSVSECWGNITLDKINSNRLAELDSYLRNMDSPRSSKSINHYMGFLKTLFYYAIKKKLYSGENSITELRPYVVDEKRWEYTADEIRRILAATDRPSAAASDLRIYIRYSAIPKLKPT